MANNSVKNGHKQPDDIAIILPAFNEESTVGLTIEAFHKVCPEAVIYVIDNASTDKTRDVSLQTFEKLGCKGEIIYEGRKGKGNAIRRSFMDIDANIYVMADADMTYPAHRLHDLIKPIADGTADIVVGDRHSGGHYAEENKRNFHKFGNDFVRKMVNYLFKSDLVDIMSGYRAFSREFVKGYPILVEGFEIETDMTLHTLDKRLRLVEIPIEYQDRPQGSFSKLNTAQDGIRVILTIAQIVRYYNPLLFFGYLALFFFILGILCGIPVINEWVNSQYITHVPLAILATGLEIFALIIFSIGVILDSIVHLNKNNFERDRLLLKSILNNRNTGE